MLDPKCQFDTLETVERVKWHFEKGKQRVEL